MGYYWKQNEAYFKLALSMNVHNHHHAENDSAIYSFNFFVHLFMSAMNTSTYRERHSIIIKLFIANFITENERKREFQCHTTYCCCLYDKLKIKLIHALKV